MEEPDLALGERALQPASLARHHPSGGNLDLVPTEQQRSTAQVDTTRPGTDLEAGTTTNAQQNGNDQSPQRPSTERTEPESTPKSRTRHVVRSTLLAFAWLFAALGILMNLQKRKPETSESKRAGYSDAEVAFNALWICVIALIVACFHLYLYRQAACIFLSFFACLLIMVVFLHFDLADLPPYLPLICDLSMLAPVTPNLIQTTLPAIAAHLFSTPLFGGGSTPA